MRMISANAPKKGIPEWARREKWEIVGPLADKFIYAIGKSQTPTIEILKPFIKDADRAHSEERLNYLSKHRELLAWLLWKQDDPNARELQRREDRQKLEEFNQDVEQKLTNSQNIPSRAEADPLELLMMGTKFLQGLRKEMEKVDEKICVTVANELRAIIIDGLYSLSSEQLFSVEDSVEGGIIKHGG